MQRVFSRNIEINCYKIDEDSIKIEGIIQDVRHCQYYLVTGEKKEPGILHKMVVTMIVKGSQLEIKDIRAEIKNAPRELCNDSLKNIKKIIGLKIEKGFISTIKKIFGGINGCTHVTNLIISMAPAAIQGYWAMKATKPIPKEFAENNMKKFLKNSCFVWDENGPLFKSLDNKTIKK